MNIGYLRITLKQEWPGGDNRLNLHSERREAAMEGRQSSVRSEMCNGICKQSSGFAVLRLDFAQNVAASRQSLSSALHLSAFRIVKWSERGE